MVWIGPRKLRVVAAPMARTSPAQGGQDFVEDAPAPPGAPVHSASRAQQIFLGDHFQDRADVLGHAAVDQHQALLQVAARVRRRRPVSIEDACGRGSSRPRLTPNSGSPAPASAPSISFMPGQTPPESCQPPPEPPSHSPRIARAATSRRSSSLSGPVSDCGLAGGPHADGDQRRQQIRRNRQPRALGNVVDVADDFQPEPGPDQHAPANRPGFCRDPSMPGGTMPGRDHRRLEQAQIILGEIEHFRQLRDVRRRPEIDADQAQHRLVDHAQIDFDGRPWARIAAAHAQVDRDIEDPRAFGIIHAQEENVAPGAVGQVHAHRRSLAQDRERAVRRSRRQQFRPQAQRLIGGMADAEHPLVAAHCADAAADLVGQRLKGQAVIGGRQGAGESIAGALVSLRGQEQDGSLLRSGGSGAGSGRQTACVRRVPSPGLAGR